MSLLLIQWNADGAKTLKHLRYKNRNTSMTLMHKTDFKTQNALSKHTLYRDGRVAAHMGNCTVRDHEQFKYRWEYWGSVSWDEVSGGAELFLGRQLWMVYVRCKIYWLITILCQLLEGAWRGHQTLIKAPSPITGPLSVLQNSNVKSWEQPVGCRWRGNVRYWLCLDCVLSLPESEQRTLLLICFFSAVIKLLLLLLARGKCHRARVTLGHLFINGHLSLWFLGLAIFPHEEQFGLGGADEGWGNA